MCETTNEQKLAYIKKMQDKINDFIFTEIGDQSDFCSFAKSGLNAMAMAQSLKFLIDFVTEHTLTLILEI